MFHFQGLSVDAGISIDGSCTMTHSALHEGIEIDLGDSSGGVHLCLTEDATVKLVDLMAIALADFRQHRPTDSAMPDRDQG